MIPKAMKACLMAARTRGMISPLFQTTASYFIGMAWERGPGMAANKVKMTARQ